MWFAIDRPIRPLLSHRFDLLAIRNVFLVAFSFLSNMPRRQRHYSILSPPSLSMSELVKTTLDHDSTDMLIDKWLEHRNFGHDAYHEWFRDVRERKHAHSQKQTVAWNKGDFLPENVFCRTVDTGRLIPLDRTWTTHVYHHHSMQERKLSMLPVVFTMVCDLS